MKTVRESTTLYNFLGSHNPYWRLTESSDVLRFSTTETTEPERTLQLSAEQAARIREMTVITSSLTKAALFGHDANWGRILFALGYSGAKFDPEAIELYLESSAGKILIFKDGMAADYSEEEATRILSCSEVTALVDMKMGEAEATAWGCDLTYDYVKINADYRS